VSALLGRLRYSVADAVDEWRQSPGPNLLAAATLAAVLFVAGIDLLLVSNASAHLSRWRRDLRVSVYLVDGAADAEIEAARTTIAGTPGVAAVERIDKDEALRRFRASFGELADLPGEMGNPLPASLEVFLTPGPGARGAARAVGEALRGSPAVEEVRYDQDVLDRVTGVLDLARWGGAALGAVVLTAVAFVVAGVLRLTVHARRDEIDIMHLVGAPPMLVRGPFLVTGAAQGLGGGLLALFLVEAARRAARAHASGAPGGLFDIAAGSPLPPGPSSLLIALGALLGFAAAWFAVREAKDVTSRT